MWQNFGDLTNWPTSFDYLLVEATDLPHLTFKEWLLKPNQGILQWRNKKQQQIVFRQKTFQHIENMLKQQRLLCLLFLVHFFFVFPCFLFDKL